MSNFFELLEQQRSVLLKKSEHLTTDQYNLVPPGFNNNIIWNMGHTLIITDSLLYSNTPFEIPNHKFDTEGFKMGTKPERPINDYVISQIRQSMSDTVPLFKKLLNDAASASFQMSQGDRLDTLISKKTLRFILFHEDMHFTKIDRLLLNV